MRRWIGVGLLGAVLAWGPGPEPLAAQEDLAPVVPAGTPVVLLPVQSARPTPGGAWPGGAASEREALATLEAELAFAFGEEDAAEWALPEQVVRRAARNPIAGVDPRRLAYQGLLRKPEPRVQLYEPLHGQLRTLSAMFGARLVVLPLALSYEVDEGELDGGSGADGPRGAEREGAGAADDVAASAGDGAGVRPAGRATLLLAVVDTRRSAVLWHGTISGDPDEAISPRSLTSLALRMADWMVP